MKVVVTDANILIDLVKLDLLSQFFAPGWEIHTTILVFHELFEEQRDAYGKYLRSGQLLIADLSGEDLIEIYQLQSGYRRLSIQDCSALFYTKQISGILLTSDKLLREHSEMNGLEVHGHLWMLDLLIQSECLTPAEAATVLKNLTDIVNPKLNLPAHEVHLRLERWKRKIR